MLPDNLTPLLTDLARRERIVFATDFDGVLAPLVDDPMTSRAAPAALEALCEAAGLPGTTVTIVSGRDLDSLNAVSAVDDDRIVLVGSHGGKRNRRELLADTDLGPAERDLHALLQTGADGLVASHPGSRVEVKPTTIVLHSRGMPPEAGEAALAAARELGAQHPEAHVMNGKDIVELSVVGVNKGTALRQIAQAVGAEATLYLGDDVTDEHAFAVLDPASGDLTVKVGPGPTRALARIDGVEQVVEVFATFVEARREWSHNSGSTA